MEVEEVAGSQPGVTEVRVQFPEGEAILVYDGKQTSPEKVAQAMLEQRPDLTITVRDDRPLP